MLNALVIEWASPYGHTPIHSGNLTQKIGGYYCIIDKKMAKSWNGPFRKHIEERWSGVHKPLTIKSTLSSNYFQAYMRQL